MDLWSELRTQGGVMRKRALEDLGWRHAELSRLFAEGLLIRPQRGWVALPDADPSLLYAAQRNVLLSCVTAIERYGLWVGDKPPELHVASRSPQAHLAGDEHRLHWGRAVRRRAPHALVDPLENALNYVASCLPFEEALAVWESALNRGLTTRQTMGRLPLRGQAVRLLGSCSELADSGLETYVRHRLEALGLRVVAQVQLYGNRVDFLIEGWLVLQVDGGHHVGRQRDSDNRHDAVLMLNGYGVMRVGYLQVRREWAQVKNRILLAVSQGPPR